MSAVIIKQDTSQIIMFQTHEILTTPNFASNAIQMLFCLIITQGFLYNNYEMHFCLFDATVSRQGHFF